MKKKKTIILLVIIAVFGVLNLMQPFQNAIAYPCNPWDPGYNFLTEECDDPEGEVEVEGNMCLVWVLGHELNAGNATDCTWAMVGTCTPVSCDEVIQDFLYGQ